MALFTLSFVSLGFANETGIRTLYLVRHGHYDPVRGGDDQVVMGLNPLGREQAAFVAERLATLPVKFSAVVSSELTRARETGDIIATHLGFTCARTPHLNETLPPGRGIRDDQVWPSAAEHLDASWKHFSQPLAADAANTHEMLVCHGNVIRWFVCRALGVPTEHWTQMEIANGSITMIQIRPDGSVRLQAFNEFAHVPVEKQTWSGRGPAWPLPAQKR